MEVWLAWNLLRMGFIPPRESLESQSKQRLAVLNGLRLGLRTYTKLILLSPSHVHIHHNMRTLTLLLSFGLLTSAIAGTSLSHFRSWQD